MTQLRSKASWQRKATSEKQIAVQHEEAVRQDKQCLVKDPYQ